MHVRTSPRAATTLQQVGVPTTGLDGVAPNAPDSDAFDGLRPNLQARVTRREFRRG
ncbi:hypothetical protein [Streptomyces sp. ISL-94]|uniref:hypothetical protein n=1 Tax=Streptomyces sp. ISL-94 TaxID=2819190 RepID=UPI0020363EF6|nr:hypothetical protein [Streptomyces sp. ISL-94]